jgi:uncharacterized protein YijF (DUF1287 family)
MGLKSKTIILIFLLIFTSTLLITGITHLKIIVNPTESVKKLLDDFLDVLPGEDRKFVKSIPKIEIDHDQDKDGIKDLADIVEGARKDAANKPVYKSAYYNGGYPPPTEGVCTDVIWRAFQNAGYSLKDMVDQDIKKNLKSYPRVEGRPDPNIDFRRVPNLDSFFKRHATILTTEIIPYNLENMKQWQAGDIVVFGKPIEHIAIVSDVRRTDGVPYIIQRGAEAVYTPEGQTQIKQNIAYYMQNAGDIRRCFESLGQMVFGGVNAPYIWLKIPEGFTSWQYFDHLLENYNIVGTPGSGFGACGEGYFRLTGFGSQENTRKAIERLKNGGK